MRPSRKLGFFVLIAQIQICRKFRAFTRTTFRARNRYQLKCGGRRASTLAFVICSAMPFVGKVEMNDGNDDNRKINPPEPHRKADLGRAAARAVAGAIPVVGSAAAELANEILPDPTAKARKHWEQHVSEGVNDLHERVDDLDSRTGTQTIELTGGTAAAAKFMLEQCPDGLAQEWTTIEQLCEAFPDLTKQELLDGLGDLESYGFIKEVSFIGSPSRYQLATYAYEVLDKPVMGWDTKADARELAREVLTMSGTVGVRTLDAKMGWPRRRFNPALRLVVDFIGDGRVSRTIQPDYVTAHFAMSNAERAELRRFVS